MIVGDPLVTFSSEKPFVLWIIFLLAVLVLWAIIVWSWSVSTRYAYIEDNKFFKSCRQGLSIVKSKMHKFLGIGILLLLIHSLFMCIYYCVLGDHGAPTWTVVILTIIAQQIFAFSRIAVRGFGYSLILDQNDR